jgi:hypothetical protein
MPDSPLKNAPVCNRVCNPILNCNVYKGKRNIMNNTMKTLFLRSFTGVAVACLAIFFSLNLFAAPSGPGDLLTQAYVTLSVADHDYKGHRIEAMKQIEAAGKILGMNVRGDGKGHEKQGTSDEQLRTAQGLLQQASSGLSGKALKHVNNAINQISTALTIK